MNDIKIGDNVTFQDRSWAVTGITRGKEKLARLCVPGDPSRVVFAPLDELTDRGPWR